MVNADMTEVGAMSWLDLEKNLAWLDLTEMTELRLTRVEEGWRCILKGKRHGRHKILFFYARSSTAVMEQCAQAVVNEKLPWKVDKYPPV